MKPQMVMLEVRPLDARKLPVCEPYKFPYIEIDNLVFVRVPEAKMKSMKLLGDIEQFRDELVNAAAGSNKSWVTVPEVVGMIDRMQEELKDLSKEGKVTMTEVATRLIAIRDELLQNNKPTNKTFLILPEAVRFLEVKEKWETIPEPQKPMQRSVSGEIPL